MRIFCPLTKTFIVEEFRQLIVPHEFLQPIEVPILEFIDKTKYNHKLFNLIQELKTIRALQLLGPLLQTKNIIRMLAKLLTTSEVIHDVLPVNSSPTIR